jgi:hypothetical protein
VTHVTVPRLTRRTAIGKLGSLVIGAAAPAWMSTDAKADLPLELLPPLRRHSRDTGIKFGCAGHAPSLQTDAILLQKIATEANIFAPEGALKWDKTEPRPGEFDFSEADSTTDFAARHDMSVHGHTLVWYAAIPPWVAQLANARDVQAALERHIGTVVPRYRGKIWAWDVVNEPIEPEDRLEGGYRKSIWQRHLGISTSISRFGSPTRPIQRRLCVSMNTGSNTRPPSRRLAGRPFSRCCGSCATLVRPSIASGCNRTSTATRSSTAIV